MRPSWANNQKALDCAWRALYVRTYYYLESTEQFSQLFQGLMSVELNLYKPPCQIRHPEALAYSTVDYLHEYLSRQILVDLSVGPEKQTTSTTTMTQAKVGIFFSKKWVHFIVLCKISDYVLLCRLFPSLMHYEYLTILILKILYSWHTNVKKNRKVLHMITKLFTLYSITVSWSGICSSERQRAWYPGNQDFLPELEADGHSLHGSGESPGVRPDNSSQGESVADEV